MSTDTFQERRTAVAKELKECRRLKEDYVEELFMTHSHHYIMFFTNTGRVYRLKAYEIPEARRTSRGTAIINLTSADAG